VTEKGHGNGVIILREQIDRVGESLLGREGGRRGGRRQPGEKTQGTDGHRRSADRKKTPSRSEKNRKKKARGQGSVEGGGSARDEN